MRAALLTGPTQLHADEALTDEHGDHDHGVPPEPFGFDLGSAWFDPWVHRHFSTRRTPYVHTFGVEPAFIDRDLFLAYGFVVSAIFHF